LFFLFLFLFFCTQYAERDWSTSTERDIIYTPVVVLEVALENGELSAEQVVRAFWNRAHAVNEEVNAVTEWNQNAIEEARALDLAYALNGTVGRLHGIPVSSFVSV
jgi:amidase